MTSPSSGVSVASTSPFETAELREPPLRERLRLVGQGEPSSEDEVRRLLRQRMKVLAVVCWCIIPVVLAVTLPTAIASRYWALLILYAIVVVMAGAGGALVWSRLKLSLTHLRILEMTIVAICCGCILAYVFNHNLGGGRYAAMFAGMAKNEVIVPAPREQGGEILHWRVELGDGAMHFFGGPYNLFWVVLIFGYALFIPNSLGRASLVIGGIALVGVGSNLVIAWYDAGIRGWALAVLLWQSVSWLGVSAALATFGSYRIERMRREAAQARKLGQYQLLQQIGRGGMGEVYLAEHLLLRRPCAVKLIRPERAGDPRNLARFEREVQATATLTNWHTVEIFDYGRAPDGTFYYVMEYLPGLNLEQLVRRHGPLPAARVVHLLRQVCAALREAHGAGLIHRDIKPSNIIVGRRGGVSDVAKLLDFGLALTHDFTGPDRITQEGTIAGTPSYMSPEQAAAVGSVDGRSDIYSLGAVAFFLLAGRPPFAGASALEVLAAHLHQTAPAARQFAPDCPEDVERVIGRCLEKGPQKRFATVQELAETLASCACARHWTETCAAAWWTAQGTCKPTGTEAPPPCLSPNDVENE